MSYVKSNLDPGFINQLNTAFMQELKPSFSKLDCGIDQDENNGQITLDFGKITKANIFLLHMLCNKHQRAYFIETHSTKGRTAFTINPPVNWR